MKAVLQKGAIVPIEPLPTDWPEGALLEIGMSGTNDFDIDAWANSMNQSCADSPAEDEEAMRRAIEEHRKEAKERTRRDMGLSA